MRDEDAEASLVRKMRVAAILGNYQTSEKQDETDTKKELACAGNVCEIAI